MVVVAWRKKKLFLYKQLISAFIYDTFFSFYFCCIFVVFVFLFFFVFVLLEVKLKAGKTGGSAGQQKKNTEFPSHFNVASFFSFRGIFRRIFFIII